MASHFNAFISYAWCDNALPVAGGQGWISLFVDRLGKHLRRELPREFSADRLWLDYEQMRGSDPITPAIRNNLAASELLVPILSKGWLASPWCQEELQLFLQRHGPESGRIFPVSMEPLEGLPAPLDELLKYPFWYEDERGQIRTRWLPDQDPTDREYGRIQQDLARDIAARLKALRPAAPGLPPPPAAPPPRPQGQHLVLIDGGDDDRPLMEAVAERLHREHGLGFALPIAAGNGLKSSEINRDRRDKLDLCTAVLLIFRHGPEPQLHQRITETLKSITKRPAHRPAPTLDLCQPCGTPVGYRPPQMRVIECSAAAPDDCARLLAELLA